MPKGERGETTALRRHILQWNMITRILSTSLLAGFLQMAASAATCESLASLKLPDTTITSAVAVGAGAFAAPAAGRGKQGPSFEDLPAFCRVAATLKPSSDSEIKIELWMPATGWNGNLEANGNGGWTGSIAPATLAAGLRRGYAAVMTDTGHEGGSASFALGHPEKVIDFGYRAVHEMTAKSKAIVAAFYEKGPRLSYWNGCSAGGRQGIMEAQRYPEDFEGIVAGSPGVNWSGRSMQAVWIGQATHKDDVSAVPASKFPAIHAAALAACDANDGVTDGVIDQPDKCKFDPKIMECKDGDSPTCLTSAQVETVRKIYSSVVNPRTKQELFPPHEPGSELGWNTMAGAQPFGLGTDLFKYIVFQDPNWDYKTFNFDGDASRTRDASVAMDALNPNLDRYFARGGKLVQYHGWADPQISPGSSVEYYQSVAARNKKADESYRLFMVPGMNHCGGGDGTDQFDMLSVLEKWVDTKKAPDQVIASRVRGGKTDRTRPLCPYPQVAVYSGSGSTDDAANFSCKKP
jgi:feruloyl esterase